MNTTLRHEILGSLIALAAASACSDNSLPGDTRFVQAALEALAQSEVDGNDFNGIGISVRLADGRVFSADAGHADPDHRAAYDNAKTEQVVGSVTKLYTAVLTMQHVEAGDISLDDTIDRWFTFPDADAITVRMLLNHTSGIGECQSNMTLEDVSRPWTPEQLIQRALDTGSFGEAPLAQAIYTNTAFVLLAVIVEKETGQTWEDNVEQRIARPLGLTHTYYAGDSDRAGGLAGGWMITDEGWLDTLDLLDPSVGWGYGAIASTNDELMRFTQALFDGELFESPTTLKAMLTFDKVTDPAYRGEDPPSTIGLAIIRMELEGVRLDGHLGHIEGFNAGAVRDPDTGALIVVTSNDNRAFAGYTAAKVAKLIRSL